MFSENLIHLRAKLHISSALLPPPLNTNTKKLEGFACVKTYIDVLLWKSKQGTIDKIYGWNKLL